MNRLIIALTLAIASASLPVAIPAQARDLKTMHFENDLPRPARVAISGAQPDQVVLYCTNISAGCKGLRAHLAKLGLDYVDKDPQTDPQAGAEFDALGGQGVPLVVFKRRLLHGYYPTSFDRLYAQYHSGTAKPPAAQVAAVASADPGAAHRPPSPGEKAGSALGNPASEPGRGAMVEDIAPEAIKAYLNRHPYVAVLYTSPDSTCPPCVKIQPDFEKAAASGLSAIRYARVQWSPWWETPAAVKPLHDKAYLPAVTVYLQGNAVAHQAGGVGANSLNAYMEKRFGFTP